MSSSNNKPEFDDADSHANKSYVNLQELAPIEIHSESSRTNLKMVSCC